jgi:hypothetical protein
MKYTVIGDELKHTHSHGSVYCIMAYDYLDAKNKSVFKISMTTTKLPKRVEQYHTYFPNGITLVAVIENPTRSLDGRTKAPKRKTHYEKIEESIMGDIVKMGGFRINATTRVRKEGDTEWVYTDLNTIHKAFQNAHTTYGGDFTPYNLNDFNKEMNIAKKKKHFMGQYIFPLIKKKKA